MKQYELGELLKLAKQSKDFLKCVILVEWNKKYSDETKLSFRDLEKITSLNSKQLQRIIYEDKFPHFDSLIKACQGILDNANNGIVKKRRE